MRRKIVLLAKHDRKTPAGGIAGDTCAIDAAAYDQQVEAIWRGKREWRVFGHVERRKTAVVGGSGRVAASIIGLCLDSLRESAASDVTEVKP